MVSLRLQTPLGEVGLFTVIATLGAPLDVTAANLAIETFLPMDPESAARPDLPDTTHNERSPPMVIVAGYVAGEPRQRESYLADYAGVVERARGAAGCLDFAITADLIDPGRVNIFER